MTEPAAATATQTPPPPQPVVIDLTPGATPGAPPPAAAARPPEEKKVPAILTAAENYTVGFDNHNGYALAQRVAQSFALSTLVPKEFQQNLPNCMIAVNMAARIGADPLMVMQNLYIVHGRPAWSAQFLIATFNTCGRFSSLRFEFFGDRLKDSWGCRAWAIEKSTGEKLYGADVTIELAKAEGWYAKSGSKWKTMPQQMLMYRSASWFVRAYSPEIGMGLQTVEELEDVGRPVIPDGTVNFDAATGEITEPTPGPKANLEDLKAKHAEKEQSSAPGAEVTAKDALPNAGKKPEADKKPPVSERIDKVEASVKKSKDKTPPPAASTVVKKGLAPIFDEEGNPIDNGQGDPEPE